MSHHDFAVTTDQLKGKIVEEVAVNNFALVIKFTDNTYLDVYLDSTEKAIKTSTNQLNVDETNN
ncbi:hypothetical protein [Alkalibacillus salilacus]|uniref:Uncharacterized protein n=1 Tax=Alkalibacillus salilacus TaxID=284582 RepID=A0ABT9VGD6_9BACI|nr:hypothetical protein [Alkalibacillus salilacus]MDQ0160008.1 hypothetical protein [Alkalibacillus salilacus]